MPAPDPADPADLADPVRFAEATLAVDPFVTDQPFDCLPEPIPSRRSLTLIVLVAILASLAALAALLGPELVDASSLADPQTVVALVFAI